MLENRLPSGISISDFHTAVEKVAQYKGRQYNSVGFMDREDLEQEIRLKCFKEVGKFDSQKYNANLLTFFSICADNRIRDIRRKIVYKANYPCTSCIFFNKKASENGEHDCRLFFNKENCPKLSHYNNHIRSKLNVKYPMQLDNQPVSAEDRQFDSLDSVDFIDYVKGQLPSGMVVQFQDFIKSNFSISTIHPKHRENFLEEMRSILEVIYGEEEKD